MNIFQATESFEQWLRQQCEVHEPDIVVKHEQMRKNAFKFFRGTYYRWAYLWPIVSPELAAAPAVLSVGDVHIENFGTWRDSDARLVWGVNDFDEADTLAYTQDLVRLAASLRMAKTHEGLSLKFGKSCRWILESYQACLEQGGEPFVLEERHAELRAIAVGEVREPTPFWEKIEQTLSAEACTPPEEVVQELRQNVPAGLTDIAYRRRESAGMGSLGKPRYLMLGTWAGGRIAREAKARTPAATVWLAGKPAVLGPVELLGRAVRCPDPQYQFSVRWIVRRLAPHCVKIELPDLDEVGKLRQLICAMGMEIANLHLGTPEVREAILADLATREPGWLEDAAELMVEAVRHDWDAWRNP